MCKYYIYGDILILHGLPFLSRLHQIKTVRLGFTRFLGKILSIRFNLIKISILSAPERRFQPGDRAGARRKRESITRELPHKNSKQMLKTMIVCLGGRGPLLHSSLSLLSSYDQPCSQLVRRETRCN